jgi:stage V sporulation protein G
MDIEIADIRKFVGSGNLKAHADVKIDGKLIIKGFRVMLGKNGIFVSLPSQVGKDGRWFETLKPLNDKLKHEFEAKVLEAYDRETDGVTS